MAELISTDASGLTQHIDIADGKFSVHTSQDVAPILENNLLLRNDEDYSRSGIKKGFWHAATIPTVIVHKWMKEGVNVFDPKQVREVNAKLNSPEYAYLKTTKKRL